MSSFTSPIIIPQSVGVYTKSIIGLGKMFKVNLLDSKHWNSLTNTKSSSKPQYTILQQMPVRQFHTPRTCFKHSFKMI